MSVDPVRHACQALPCAELPTRMVHPLLPFPRSSSRRSRSNRHPFTPLSAGPYRLPRDVRDRLATDLAPFRNRDAAFALATFLGRFWATPSRLLTAFPIDETRERAGAGRSAFAGLRLGREAQPSPGATEPAHVRLERAAETYARAWADAKRMRTAGLPVLPHQEQALAKAGADLDRLRPHGAQDLRVALTVRPELAKDTDRITATLTRLAAERDARERPEPDGTAARLGAAVGGGEGEGGGP